MIIKYTVTIQTKDNLQYNDSHIRAVCLTEIEIKELIKQIFQNELCSEFNNPVISVQSYIFQDHETFRTRGTQLNLFKY